MDDASVLKTPTFVVGVGASAGGLEAMEAFFDNLPSDTGMAFVVVQHLSPDFKSMMDDLLGRHTAMPIHSVTDGMRVEPNHVYLIPPKKEMIISEGHLLLSERDPQQELSLPIDVFFRSLAQDAGAKAIAVVLSGSGSDGSRGARDVHDAGGFVAVQNPATAQFDGMPRAAIDTGIAHTILPPHEIPQALLLHAGRSDAAHASELPRETPHGIGAVYEMLLHDYGLDFTQYKPSTVTRRIERRIALAQSNDIEQYVERLRRDRDELDILYRDLLIGVTRFFRDEAAFALLEQKVLPELLDRGARDTPLRIWVAGCATGEEAYSFAIVLAELMRHRGDRPVKIFATDVHAGSLERAARAIYEEDALTSVSPERLQRYFTKVGSSYQVVPDLRQMVVFAAHNVIKNAPFTRVDLITCRNLLIYLQPPAQQKVLSLFHFALNRGGYLFLGPSESPGTLAHDFESVDKHWRLYRKHSDVRTPVEARLQPFPQSDGRPSFALVQGQPGRYSISQLLGTYDVLLDDVMPPSLLLNDRGELVHAFGGASRFLRLRDGRQRLDVLEVADDELKMVLAGGLKRALHEPNAIVFKGVRIGDQSHDVTIRSVRSRSGPPHVLVSFVEPDRPAPPPKTQTVIDLDQVSRQQLASLEAQLSNTKESLQSTIEQLETSNEELQASNEELQASNEELQSTNEELQSVNEELYTVNAEYQRKIAELTEMTNDMDNLLASTDIGTIFLDSSLRIRRFTPKIADTFALVAHDVGRSIETFGHKLDYPQLVRDLRSVLSTGTPIETQLPDVAGKSLFLRLLPYRAKGRVDGVVLTIIDVTSIKAAEDALFHERHLLNSLLGTVRDAIYFKDAGGRFIRANAAMAARLGLQEGADVAGKTVFDFPSRELALALHQEDQIVLGTGKAQHNKLEQRRRDDGTTQWELVTRLPMRDPSGAVVGVCVIFRDVTREKLAEEKSQEAVRRRDEFLAMLSHELRNPLSAIVQAIALLESQEIGGTRAADLVTVLRRQSKQMARLLDDLLETSRVTQDKIELRKSIISLPVVVREAIEASRALFESRQIELAVEIDPSLEAYVLGDSARLQQVHVNLLSNAAKYTPPGGHVVVSVTREGEQAVVRVRDDGFGIAKDMLETVFDLFVQCRSTLDRSAGGLGLGLTLVRSLVTMHGGTVTAHSEGEGKGTELVVRLPIVSAKPNELAKPAAVAVRVPAGGKVVVVEDNHDSRELLRELLEHAGFHCRTADTGSQGLALIEEFRPHVALVDVGLPELDGFEIARRLRQNASNSGTHLIALTGYGRAEDRETAARSGFDAHLVKPVDPSHLLALLGRTLGN